MSELMSIQHFWGIYSNPPAELIERGQISNSGSQDKPDYVGVVFPDGSVSVRWLGEFPFTSLFDSYEDFWQMFGRADWGLEHQGISNTLPYIDGD